MFISYKELLYDDWIIKTSVFNNSILIIMYKFNKLGIYVNTFNSTDVAFKYIENIIEGISL